MYTPKLLAKTDLLIKIADGYDENGSPKIAKELTVQARHQSDCSTIYTKDGHKITLRAKVFIFEGFEELHEGMTGQCIMGTDVEYDIVNASRKTNPDGSTNHFVLELI